MEVIPNCKTFFTDYGNLDFWLSFDTKFAMNKMLSPGVKYHACCLLGTAHI